MFILVIVRSLKSNGQKTRLSSHRVQWIVVEQYKPDVGRASKRELVYDFYLIVPQQNGCYVLKTGERELIERLKWRVLDR